MASKKYDPALLGLESGERPLTLALDTETDLTWNKYGDALVTISLHKTLKNSYPEMNKKFPSK